MKYLPLFIAALAMGTSCSNGVAQSKDPITATTENGLNYVLYPSSEAERTSIVGDIAEMHIVFKVGDSTIISSREMNNNKPVMQPLQASGFPGDLNEGLLLLKSGDSAVFSISVDTLVARTQQPMPPFAKTGDIAKWEVKVVSIKSKEQFEEDQKKEESAQVGKDEETLKEHFKKNNIKAQKGENGLYYVIHKEGEGVQPTNGQTVVVNYTGMLLDGTKFDSNTDPEFQHVAPLDFVIGQGRVIKGWDLGVPVVKKGGSVTLYIPAHLAYGNRSPSPKIPANSILVFDVELLEIK